MSTIVACPQCGARLAYQGKNSKVRPCPKCKTPIAFVVAPTDTPPSAGAVPTVPGSQVALASPTTTAPAEPTPSAAPILAEAVAEATAAPSPAAPPAVTLPKSNDALVAAPPKRSRKAAWLLGCGAVGAGGMLLLLLTCGGIIALASMGRGQGTTYDEKGDIATINDWSKGGTSTYTPDYSASSYASDSKAGDSSPSYNYTDPYAAPASNYQTPSYDAAAGYKTPASTAPSIADSSSTPPLWDFSVPPDRITALPQAVAADERALADLNDGTTVTAGIGLIGAVVENFSGNADYRDRGARTRDVAKEGVDFLAQQRAIIQSRLDANRAELARLQAEANAPALIP